ncbi:mucin-5AC-like [Acropora millepora]|uniref:mucin-5AC-like n=1 Tax=Acropora millepora TaxID=45264 RepID=UPI001CF23485|nr:mucin-5AC-like [Acropora millepora]
MEVEEDSDASSSDSEVPSTTASVTPPVVTSPPVISTSPVTAVCSTVAAPTSCPTVAVPVNVSTGSTTAASVSAPSAPVSTASARSTASTVTVSTASVLKSSSDVSTVSAPSLKKPRTVVSREIFRQRLAKHCTTVELPSFDNVKGKEWDTRAKAYIRQQVKIIFEDKRIGITKSGFAPWDLEDLDWLRNDTCNILSISNYLTDYVFDVLRDYWNNSRIAMGMT